MAEVDEDLAKHLHIVDELVLDDQFYGDPSTEIDYTKDSLIDTKDDKKAEPSRAKDAASDFIINDPRPKEADEFDMHLSIGFKDADAMISSTDSATMVASTDSDALTASGDGAAFQTDEAVEKDAPKTS